MIYQQSYWQDEAVKLNKSSFVRIKTVVKLNITLNFREGFKIN